MSEADPGQRPSWPEDPTPPYQSPPYQPAAHQQAPAGWQPPSYGPPPSAQTTPPAWGAHQPRPSDPTTQHHPAASAHPASWPIPPQVAPDPRDPWGGRPLQGDERTWVPASHWLGLLTSWLGPVVILLTVGERNLRVRAAARESVNFEITITLALLASALLAFVGVGFLLIGIVALVWLALRIIATVESAKGRAYRYPVSIRIVR